MEIQKLKAIIPVAGIGSKLRPHTHTHPKALIPLAGKPILGHILDRLLKAGVTHFTFIVGYMGDKIKTFISSHYPNIETSFVIQLDSQGIGHALWLAREEILAEEACLIVLGDTVFEANLEDLVKQPISSLGTRRVDDPRFFGVAELDAKTGLVKKLVEKPVFPKSNIALVGIYFIKNAQLLVKALDLIIQRNFKTQGEYQLTDALMVMLEQGHTFQTFAVDNWYDCGKKEIILETNAALLKRMSDTPIAEEYLQNAVIIPPVIIAKNCILKNAIVGPYVSVGENAVIEDSIVSNSIVGSFTQLRNIILKNSIVGNDSSIKGLTQSLNIGDNTEINF